jgi:hypothetical protein
VVSSYDCIENALANWKVVSLSLALSQRGGRRKWTARLLDMRAPSANEATDYDAIN